MYRYYVRIAVFVSILAVGLYALPVMSVCLSGGESCTLLVRGYNLMEFSAWGCIPLLAPSLVPVIRFGHQKQAVIETELMLLFIISMVCYVHSLNAARAWLDLLGGSLITYHFGIFLCPVAFVIALTPPYIYASLLLRLVPCRKRPVVAANDERNSDGDRGDEDDEDLPF